MHIRHQGSRHPPVLILHRTAASMWRKTHNLVVLYGRDVNKGTLRQRSWLHLFAQSKERRKRMLWALPTNLMRASLRGQREAGAGSHHNKQARRRKGVRSCREKMREKNPAGGPSMAGTWEPVWHGVQIRWLDQSGPDHQSHETLIHSIPWPWPP